MHVTVGTYMTYQTWYHQSHKINHKEKQHYVIKWENLRKTIQGKNHSGKTFPKMIIHHIKRNFII